MAATRSELADAARAAAFLLAAATALVAPAGLEASGGAQGLQLTVAMGVAVVERGVEWMMSVKPVEPSSSRSWRGGEAELGGGD